MLGRLLLVLLAIVFATPVATAACHAPTESGRHASAPHHESMPTDTDEGAPAEACVGCVPPSSWDAARVPQPVLAPEATHAVQAIVLSLGRATPPALPPPRIA